MVSLGRNALGSFWLFLWRYLQAVECTFPPLWDVAPAHISQFPAEEGYYIIDPWNYTQRLGIYKVLLGATEKSMESFGENNTGNVLWGLPLQHGWQYNTSRLKDEAHTSPCGFPEDPLCISTNSWWASMNYYLSVIPFLGALDAGFWPEYFCRITILQPPSFRGFETSPNPNFKNVEGETRKNHHPTKKSSYLSPICKVYGGRLWNAHREYLYCTTVQDCKVIAPEAMKHWRHFFLHLKDQSQRHTCKNGNFISDKRSKLEDVYLKHMWTAHIHSIETGLELFRPQLKYFSPPERAFGTGWAKLVGFVAATRFATNFKETNYFQHAFLPKRMLTKDDRPPDISDMTSSENRALFLISNLGNTNRFIERPLMWFWQRAMCSADGRETGRFLMAHMITQPSSLIKGLLHLLWDTITQTCDTT